MNILKGSPVVEGQADGIALVTRQPINFTAAFSKPANLLPGRRSQIQDRHHDLYGHKIKGKILVFPAAIGSTYTGMMLLNLMAAGEAPIGMIVQKADSLLVSGSILAAVWYKAGVPIIACSSDALFDQVQTDCQVTMDGHSGEIRIL